MRYTSDTQRKAMFANMGTMSATKSFFAQRLEPLPVRKALEEQDFDNIVSAHVADERHKIQERKARNWIERELGVPFEEAMMDPGAKDMYEQVLNTGQYVAFTPDPYSPGRLTRVPRLQEE